ncbi:MAG: hypothetical protein AB7I96_12985 [Candidatus Dadabacteria bacterium]
MKQRILIGSDPEVFVFDEGRDHFISAHNLIPGTKEEPYKVIRGAIQRDGVAAEFNIDPAASKGEFVSNIQRMMKVLQRTVSEVSKSYSLRAIPTCWFPQDYFDSLPDQVKELGCNPDWNAYTRDRNAPPQTDKPFRTGSGHIHFGWTMHEDCETGNHFAACVELTRLLDKTLYLDSLTWDRDETRRELYGKIGAFRPKHYGLEYRVLSNAFLNSPKNVARVYEIAHEVASDFFGYSRAMDDGVTYHEEVA